MQLVGFGCVRHENKVRIGLIDLGELPLFLAPMEDVTYMPFRYMCKRFGADVMSTEFVSSEALKRDVQNARSKMNLFDFDRPIGIQIYGHDIESMVQAAQLAELSEPDFIDINFGCPMKKIVKKGAGACFLQDVPKMQQMTAAIVKAVKLPVTAKTRLGWDENNISIVEVAERLQDVGIVALTIHGRTRSQLYTGTANWETIAKVKANPRIHIPIIGNGDINSPEKAKKCFEISGVDGLMIGRGAIGRPWIFKEIKHYFKTGELLPLPVVAEVVKVMTEQLQRTIDWKENEKSGILMMRRHFAKCFPALPDFRSYRTSLLRAITLEELQEALDLIQEVYGDYTIDHTKVSLTE